MSCYILCLQSDYSSSPKQSICSSAAVPSLDDIAVRRPSLAKAKTHLLQRTLSETVRHRRGDKNQPGCGGVLGKQLSSSQFGM